MCISILKLKTILNILRSRYLQNTLFVFLLLVVYIFYNYYEILFLKPQGIHFIRQTDSLSFVLGYYKYGMNFFEPKGLNLINSGGKAVSEFPILYYTTACLYFIFGEKEFILRLLNISIVSMGFFFLFKLIRNFLQDVFYAFLFTFLFLSSTILIYYTNNFLPDASALGFSLMAWYYFYKFLSTKEKKKLILSFFFFTMSSLLKVTFFINPIAAFLTLFYLIFITKKLTQTRFVLLLFAGSLLINLLWIAFVIYYNKSNGEYYLTNIRPIWRLSSHSIYDVWDHISNYWYTKYYFQTTIHLMTTISVLGVIFIRKIKIKMLIPAILLALGSLIYILLFYEMFKDHDYYFITLLPTIIFIVIASFSGIQIKYPKLISHFTVRLILLFICLLSLNYSKKKLDQRYSTNIKSSISYVLNGFEDYLSELGVGEFSKVIVVKDISRNGSLYMLKRQGWILNDFAELNKATISKYVKLGAEYLVLTDKTKAQNLLKFGQIIGEKNGVTVIKLLDTN